MVEALQGIIGLQSGEDVNNQPIYERLRAKEIEVKEVKKKAQAEGLKP